MDMATKYEVIYRQLMSNIEEIKEVFEYKNDSISFGHLMLKYIFNISDHQANECMTDGGNDNGIDAIYFEKDNNDNLISTHFFQFKLPSDPTKLNVAVKRDEVLKVIEGYEYFTGNTDKFNTLKWNELLEDKRGEYLTLNSFNHNVWLIRFSTFDNSENEELLKNKIKRIETETGYSINTNLLKASEITELHEKSRLNDWPSFDLNYKRSLGIFSDENSSIYHAYVSIKSIYEALNPIKSIVLEGNVRYYDPRSNINEDIRLTLQNDHERFHLLNNGITIVCQNVNDKSASDTFVIERGSIINGAQTIGTIIRFMDSISDEEKEKYNQSYVYVKVIKLIDINSLVEDIVFTLNTQNTMKLSYRISNNQTIKDIQTKINKETEFYLELKKNEYYHKKDIEKEFTKTLKNVIDIELFIQCFIAYYNIHDLGHITKTSKGALFSSDRLEKIVPQTDKDNMLHSYKVY